MVKKKINNLNRQKIKAQILGKFMQGAALGLFIWWLTQSGYQLLASVAMILFVAFLFAGGALLEITNN